MTFLKTSGDQKPWREIFPLGEISAIPEEQVFCSWGFVSGVGLMLCIAD